MEIKGKCIAVADLRSGQSQSGNNWQKRDFVIETTEKYPRKVCLTLFGDKVSLCPSVGSYVSVSFDIDAHEYNGKWYNQINAWRVEQAQAQAQAQAQPQVQPQVQPQPQAQPQQHKEELPF